MILKEADNKDALIAELERLMVNAVGDRRTKIEQELRLVCAGLKGEQEASYFIDFDMKVSTQTGVIHDLRLVVDGRVAQIDHLLIHRTLNIFVVETKHFHSGVKITEEGEFLRRNAYKKTYEGMASPLAQNQRHIDVLKDAFSSIDLPKRMGVRLSPVFHSLILVSPNAFIERPQKFDTSQIVKADMLAQAMDSKFDNASVLDTLSSMSRFVSMETVEEIGRRLIALHQPADFDYAARFDIREAKRVNQELQKPTCRACAGHELSIEHGRYGYYFKCRTCEGNTPIKIGCGQPGHKERIRKAGRNFYRECADCQTSSLFFVNPV